MNPYTYAAFLDELEKISALGPNATHTIVHRIAGLKGPVGNMMRDATNFRPGASLKEMLAGRRDLRFLNEMRPELALKATPAQLGMASTPQALKEALPSATSPAKWTLSREQIAAGHPMGPPPKPAPRPAPMPTSWAMPQMVPAMG